MYVYVYVYVYIRMYICMSMYMYITRKQYSRTACITNIHTCTNACIHGYIHLTNTYMSKHVNTQRHRHITQEVHINTQIQKHRDTNYLYYIYIYIHTYIHTYIHMNTDSHTYMHVISSLSFYIHACKCTCKNS